MVRTFRSIIVVTLAAALMCAAAGGAFAAKGGGKGGGGGKPGGSTGGGTVSLPVILSSSSTDGVPHHGDTVTFTVSTTATDRPYVGLTCTQGRTLVYSGQVGYFPDYPWWQYFVLDSSYWTPGTADCTATLQTWNGRSWASLASVNFQVAA
jgi:hypothetical protein